MYRIEIVPIPRTPNIATIFKNYKKDKNVMTESHRSTLSDDLCHEVLDGLQVYFNRALGTMLLYRFERQQYLDMSRKFENTSLCEIYGGEHLLRLFVRLPTLLNHLHVEEELILALRDQIQDLIHWFSEHASAYLLHDYENPTHEYLNLAKSH
ncbi:Esa1p-associated factor [Coelomomyces lativittatus]|nr:Esa1p-associated factor [Coelomomyces lativittatus]